MGFRFNTTMDTGFSRHFQHDGEVESMRLKEENMTAGVRDTHQEAKSHLKWNAPWTWKAGSEPLGVYFPPHSVSQSQ